MAHSLEVRVPFLDHHLVEYAATIPGSMKVRRTTTKYILKRAARGLIPDEIIDKPKIGFFAASVDRWFTAQTRGVIAEYLLAPAPKYAEFVDRDVVAGLVEHHASGTDRSNGRLLLSLLMLEVWLSTYLPRATSSPREAQPLSVSA
jgi:asparagine synthase (glutamine-hydrolysing)